ncbi:hypothetical protein SAMN02799625_03790 [Methylobacterium sp. UNC300MFChir4.1]|nr:hypothetical protein SAMN02799625_03790 [Methylobacterium sp. UNC300MFChir4.1]
MRRGPTGVRRTKQCGPGRKPRAIGRQRLRGPRAKPGPQPIATVLTWAAPARVPAPIGARGAALAADAKPRLPTSAAVAASIFRCVMVRPPVVEPRVAENDQRACAGAMERVNETSPSRGWPRRLRLRKGGRISLPPRSPLPKGGHGYSVGRTLVGTGRDGTAKRRTARKPSFRRQFSRSSASVATTKIRTCSNWRGLGSRCPSALSLPAFRLMALGPASCAPISWQPSSTAGIPVSLLVGSAMGTSHPRQRFGAWGGSVSRFGRLSPASGSLRAATRSPNMRPSLRASRI